MSFASKYRWQLHLLVRRTTSPAIAAVLFFGAAYAIFFSANALDRRASAATLAARALNTAENAWPSTPARVMTASSRDLEQNSLPEEVGVTGALDPLLDEAARYGLTLTSAEYKNLELQGKSVGRLAIVLPVRGEHENVQRFISHALQQNPYLALESLELDRAKIGDRVLDMRLNFVQYYRMKKGGS